MRVSLPAPSVSGACSFSPASGFWANTALAVAPLSHLSNSGRAAVRRASSLSRRAASCSLIATNRARSSGRGTGIIGGVFWMLPSIAFCVVLLKNADSA